MLHLESIDLILETTRSVVKAVILVIGSLSEVEDARNVRERPGLRGYPH